MESSLVLFLLGHNGDRTTPGTRTFLDDVIVFESLNTSIDHVLYAWMGAVLRSADGFSTGLQRKVASTVPQSPNSCEVSEKAGRYLTQMSSTLKCLRESIFQLIASGHNLLCGLRCRSPHNPIVDGRNSSS